MEVKKILVIGMARSGIAAAQLLAQNGHIPILADTKPLSTFTEALAPLCGVECIYRFGTEQLPLLDECDGVIISPGVPIQAPVVREALHRGIPLIGEMEYASSCLKGELYAITGTNGKTTTTTLLGEILKNSGKQAHVAGNIGYPLSLVALEAREQDVTVAEVSSFQLESIEHFHPHIAALLNITEDHLNRHGTMEEYIRLKKRIFENQASEDYAILNMDDSLTASMGSSLKAKVLYFSRKAPVENGCCVEEGMLVWKKGGHSTPLCPVENIRIPGPHNLENALAASAMACAAGVAPQVIRSTLESFAGVEHRIETVRTLNGITYINDSKGTNVDSTIKAVQSMKQPTVIILGGFDKHTDFMPLCREIVNSGIISHAVILGQTGPQITRQLQEAGYNAIHQAATLAEAVSLATALCRGEGNVLLSPACASFDMFSCFEERGEVFKQLVMALPL